MKTTTKDLICGGSFALISNLSAFLLFVTSVIFPFDWLQQLTVLCVSIVPCILYYIFAKHRTISFAIGMLSAHIVAVVINILLGVFEASFIDFLKPLVYGEPGLLFGIEFLLDFFLRVIALTYPPIIHLIAHAVSCVKKKNILRK